MAIARASRGWGGRGPAIKLADKWPGYRLPGQGVRNVGAHKYRPSSSGKIVAVTSYVTREQYPTRRAL